MFDSMIDHMEKVKFPKGILKTAKINENPNASSVNRKKDSGKGGRPINKLLVISKTR